MPSFTKVALMIAVVLGLGAVLAPAASATNFTASGYPTAATATSEKGNDNFKTEAGSVECKGHFAIATLGEASETATVTPTYTECQAFGFFEATVTMNGCDYVFHATEGGVDVECPAGKLITIVASTCEATVGTQTNEHIFIIGGVEFWIVTHLQNVALSNSGYGISAKANVGGIRYTVTKDGFLCPFKGTGAKTGATYVQNKAVQVNSTNGTIIDIG